MYPHAHAIARQARFNNCPVISIHRNYNLAGQTQWELLIGTDPFGGFKESVAPTKKEAIERARDVVDASNGFVSAIYAQRGAICNMYKVDLRSTDN